MNVRTKFIETAKETDPYEDLDDGSALADEENHDVTGLKDTL